MLGKVYWIVCTVQKLELDSLFTKQILPGMQGFQNGRGTLFYLQCVPEFIKKICIRFEIRRKYTIQIWFETKNKT